MMKIALELKNEPRTNDLLIFDGKLWKTVSLESLINKQIVEIKNLSDEVKDLKERLEKVEHELAYNRGEEEKL